MYDNLTDEQKQALVNMENNFIEQRDKYIENSEVENERKYNDSLFGKLQREMEIYEDELENDSEIIGCSIDIELLKEYETINCIECYFCNQGDVREFAPIMVWTARYLYLFTSIYSANMNEIIVYDSFSYTGYSKSPYDLHNPDNIAENKERIRQYKIDLETRDTNKPEEKTEEEF